MHKFTQKPKGIKRITKKSPRRVQTTKERRSKEVQEESRLQKNPRINDTTCSTQTERGTHIEHKRLQKPSPKTLTDRPSKTLEHDVTRKELMVN